MTSFSNRQYESYARRAWRTAVKAIRKAAQTADFPGFAMGHGAYVSKESLKACCFNMLFYRLAFRCHKGRLPPRILPQQIHSHSSQGLLQRHYFHA